MRLSKNVNGTQYTYLYFGGLLMQETRGSRVINYFYDANGQAIALRYRSSSSADWAYYYYDYNSRGEAMEAFQKMVSLSPEELEIRRKHLLKYCKLDTFAMVKVWERLKEAVKE